jgi:hypothetical protein
MQTSLVKAIVSYGKRYQQEELKSYHSDELANDWWLALAFFLNRASFQGRRDELSYRVYEHIRAVLEPMFSNDRDWHTYEMHRQQAWKAIKGELQQRIGKGKVGKARDIEMVLSALQFISNVPDNNIVAYSVQRIRRGDLVGHYWELQRSSNRFGIVQVGPKIASFYLRDIVTLYQLESSVTEDALFYLHPVDVWVRKFFTKTGVVDDGADDSTIRRAIVTICNEHQCSAVEFNQGSWYVGYHAFDLLLEKLNEAH